MKATRKILTITLAMMMTVGAAPLLAGCANPIQAAVEKAAQNAVKDATGGNVDLNVDGNGASMPADWPSDVPVISGKILASARLGSGDSETWTVSITADSGSWPTIKNDFESNGFTTDFESTSSDGSLGTFSDGSYSVVVTLSTDSSGTTANYVVSRSVQTQ